MGVSTCCTLNCRSFELIPLTQTSWTPNSHDLKVLIRGTFEGLLCLERFPGLRHQRGSSWSYVPVYDGHYTSVMNLKNDESKVFCGTEWPIYQSEKFRISERSFSDSSRKLALSLDCSRISAHRHPGSICKHHIPDSLEMKTHLEETYSTCLQDSHRKLDSLFEQQTLPIFK